MTKADHKRKKQARDDLARRAKRLAEENVALKADVAYFKAQRKDVMDTLTALLRRLQGL